MQLLRRATEVYGSNIEVVLFGSTTEDDEFAELSKGFLWKLAGVLNKEQMAQLLNEVDIFVDFSSHQAMGLTALEAMACGVAVIVPSNGGAVTFARNGVNSIVVDTSYKEACWSSLQQIIENDELRAKLQKNATKDVCSYFPERSALRILEALFNEESP
jgi:glycosyltransferase involved in cell wall biosynthesis